MRSVWAAIKENGGFQTGWLRGCVEVWDQASLLDQAVLEADKDDNDGSSERICDVNLGVADKIAGKWFLADIVPGH